MIKRGRDAFKCVVMGSTNVLANANVGNADKRSIWKEEKHSDGSFRVYLYRADV